MRSSRISHSFRDNPSRGTPDVVAFMASLVLLCTALIAFDATPINAATPCGAGSNPIVCENSKPGTPPTIWDIDGAGDDDIQGFSTDISVNVGGTIGFKVATPASAYTITIFRTGYYQGLGAREVATVTPSATLPQVQPQCITDAATEIYDCGTWKLSASWTVPATAVSGVYFALLRRPDSGHTSHITFIVRDDSSHSSVLFQTSDPTWQAYNTYGGSDFYQGAANGRAFKVSYNRPVATRGANVGRDFFFSNEYPTIRFLEKNGYDVSYFSGVDTDRYGTLLKNHKVFLSVGHDEYWSTGQRASVEAARDAGVNLQFLSGNEAYWHTRYEPSLDASKTNYRTLVSYKETWASTKLDPSTTWTGTWRDPRFSSRADGGGLPENALTGTAYMSNNDDLPITVSAIEGKLRLWRNAGLSAQAAGTKTALAAHTIGYESDEDLNNGFRPSGLIDLSTTTGVTPQYLQDFGLEVAPGTTTHHVTLYRAASGALVFGAGTIQWGWGLDQTHDGNGAPGSGAMQQAQVNLLADMGAQPLTLVAPLVAATASVDTTPPTVTVSAPVTGTAIANGTPVTITGTASDVGGVIAGVNISLDNGTTWHPAVGTSSWSYAYIQHGIGGQKVLIRAVDDSANYSATPASVTYTIGGPYSVFGAEVPKAADYGDPSAAELGLRFTPTTSGFISGVRFYKSTANTGVHVGSVWSSAGVRLATVNFANETASGWQSARFAIPVAVQAATTYTVSYTDPNGHYAAANYYWAYGTSPVGPMVPSIGTAIPITAGAFSGPGIFPDRTDGATNYYVDAIFELTDTSPLSVSNPAPLPGSSSVALGSSVSAVFSRDANPTSVVFAVRAPNGVAVAGSTVYSASTRTAIFTAAQPLATSTKYSVVLSATDLNGVQLSVGGSWSFTTVQPPSVPGQCPCSLFDDTATPSIVQVNDLSAVTLGLRFTALRSGLISGIKFFKAAGNTGIHTATLWSSTGTTLGSATFGNESTAGWQTASFATPLLVTAGTAYIAAYRTTVGDYSATPGYYAGAGFDRGPLEVASQAGTYSYQDVAPLNQTSTDYGVDVVFKNSAASFTLVSTSPAAGAISIDHGTAISATLSAPVANGYTVAVSSAGSSIAGVVSLSADRQTIKFIPAAQLPNNATVAVTLSNLATADGVTLATQSWSFTTLDSLTTVSTSLFGSEVPAVAAAGDASAVELGLTFTPSVDGTVSAIRFYKGAGNIGTHKGHLWSSTGQLLATVTFADETDSGWQSAALSAPLAITSGKTYTVSYLAPNGHYSLTSNYFSTAKTSGPLTAAAGTNGLYTYGSAGGWPTNSYNSSNYFVDVVFVSAVPTAPAANPNPTPTPTPAPAGTSIFSSTSVPANVEWADHAAVQVGVRFSSSVAGTITGIRFYKGPDNTGPHQVFLWGADATQLATATSSNETASGWQTVALSQPVSIVAGVEYRATYYTTVGLYSLDVGGLASSVTTGPLSTVASGGTYGYSTLAPAGTASHNYWVDVTFVAGTIP
ncbi:MAG: DUF4082 domain-containing protein [Microbacteriaceae bacterium]|nr:DUF4082 domain-containing protein [Microbacteriaceae bacterium]